MDRRAALKIIAAAAVFPTPPVYAASNTMFGWAYNKHSIEKYIRNHRYPYFSQQNELIKGTGKGKKAFLHKAFERVSGGKFTPHHQKAPDCVSQAAALAVDFLSSVQIARGEPQRWVNKAATEPIYGGSRVEIGDYRGMGGGSTGHWAAEWMVSYGILLRQEYPGHDFTKYDAKKAIKLGREGCPDELEPIAKLHPIKKAAICTSYSDMCDAIYNGSPVMVCSNVGFGDSSDEWVRDSEGFLTRKRRPWYHAMLFGGYDDSYERPGALCFNSWGSKWVSGPTRGPQPPGSFWIDAKTVDNMLSQGDSFAFSAFKGFPRVVIPDYILH